MRIISKTEIDALKQHAKEHEEILLGIRPLPEWTREDEYWFNVKFAICQTPEGGYRTIYQHNETGEQYEFTYEVSKRESNRIDPPLKFVRWARPMDL